jgi:hypothetical protein
VLSPHYFQRKEAFVQPFLYDETLANTSKQSKGEKKRRNKERERTEVPGLKDKTQSESQRGKGTNHVPKPPFLSLLKQNRK